MTGWGSAAVLEGAPPPEGESGSLPVADSLTATGFARLIDRGLSLAVLLMLFPMAVLAYRQLDQLDGIWLSVVGGALVASSVLMPLYAWSRRGIRPLARVYAVAVLAGLVAWPVAWVSPEPSSGAPLLWLVLGLATLCFAISTSAWLGIGYAVVAGAVFFLVRQTPSGGDAGMAVALQDALVTVVEPAVVLLALQWLRAAIADLDAQLAAQHAAQVDAATNRALVDERRRLDAIVHDEIMTTLVAGARSSGTHDPRVADQARAAMASLRLEEERADEDVRVSADQAVRLIKDVTTSVCPRAQVIGEIPAAAVTLPSDVVRTFMQTAREAALNAEKHSGAAQVQVVVEIAVTARRLILRTTVTDNGRGFDPGAVPAERLGLRLAIRERMLTVGGTAEVTSTPGRGTVVRLAWSGDRERAGTAPDRTRGNLSAHPLFRAFNMRPILWLGGLAILTYAAVGASTLPLLAHPELMALATLILGVALVAVVHFLWRGPVPLPAALLAAAAVLVGAALGFTALPHDPWPEHGAWFLVVVVLIVVAVYAGGRAVVAWGAALGFAGVAATASRAQGVSWIATLLLVAPPLIALLLSRLLFFWLDTLWARLDQAEASVARAAEVNATMFSRMVLREVWLAELRDEVGPLLELLADPRRPLSDEDRAGLLLMESSLRDQIKASNFNAPGLSAAIMAARRRGVLVTLVDNRGSRLPETVRRVAIQHVQRVVESARQGRIVARTAPEGYTDVVTILEVGVPGETRLTRIDDEGTVTTADPAATERD